LAGAQHAAGLVSQMLLFSRRHHAARRPTRCQPEVQRVLDALRAALPGPLELQADMYEACGPVLGEGAEIRQVIRHLCDNAVQAIGDAGGTVRVSLDEVNVGCAETAATPGLRRGRHARLRAQDTGIGMDATTLSRIFEPYFTTRGPGAGTGLGLATVHGLVRDYGGAIHVESAPGDGTTFTVFLPICEPEAGA